MSEEKYNKLLNGFKELLSSHISLIKMYNEANPNKDDFWDYQSASEYTKLLESLEDVKSETQKENEDLMIEYPIQDDIWPSRRWNKEGTEYIDLSGG